VDLGFGMAICPSCFYKLMLVRLTSASILEGLWALKGQKQ